MIRENKGVAQSMTGFLMPGNPKLLVYVRREKTVIITIRRQQNILALNDHCMASLSNPNKAAKGDKTQSADRISRKTD